MALPGQPIDAPLYLITSGPAKQVWTFHAVFRGTAVELMPICGSHAQMVELLEGLQDKSLQAATTSLAKLQVFVQEHPLFFVLNPKIKFRFDQPFFIEAPDWMIGFDQLEALLLALTN